MLRSSKRELTVTDTGNTSIATTGYFSDLRLFCTCASGTNNSNNETKFEQWWTNYFVQIFNRFVSPLILLGNLPTSLWQPFAAVRWESGREVFFVKSRTFVGNHKGSSWLGRHSLRSFQVVFVKLTVHPEYFIRKISENFQFLGTSDLSYAWKIS